jgi:hypothetical protein
MKVDKDKFDAVLGRLVKTVPIKNADLKLGRKKKAATPKPSRDQK